MLLLNFLQIIVATGDDVLCGALKSQFSLIRLSQIRMSIDELAFLQNAACIHSQSLLGNRQVTSTNAAISFPRMNISEYVGRWVLTVVCCIVVGLGLRLHLMLRWRVVLHPHPFSLNRHRIELLNPNRSMSTPRGHALLFRRSGNPNLACHWKTGLDHGLPVRACYLLVLGVLSDPPTVGKTQWCVAEKGNRVPPLQGCEYIRRKRKLEVWNV